jgi:hypothetical protein
MASVQVTKTLQMNCQGLPIEAIMQLKPLYFELFSASCKGIRNDNYSVITLGVGAADAVEPSPDELLA